MDGVNNRIEQQITTLLRRGQHIHVYTSSGEIELDRSAYGILCRIADEGPQRLGSFASAFGLDPSTITRQVQALEKAELAIRATDEADRRASILDLTDKGKDALDRTRAYRRQRLEELLSAWSQEDREDLGRLLEKLNTSIEELVAKSPPHPPVH